MVRKVVEALFYSNYFIGFLAIALAMETAFQLQLAWAPLPFYGALFSGTALYYTFAYRHTSVSNLPANPRIAWYKKHQKAVRYLQYLNLTAFITFTAAFILPRMSNFRYLNTADWLLLGTLPFLGILYYGKPLLHIRWRDHGLLKSISIGMVWAIWVSLLPVYCYKISNRSSFGHNGLLFWYFLKNFMFCTLNAIIFDIKDYAEDANREIKTLAVCLGLKRLLLHIIIPLCLTGCIASLIFNLLRGASRLHTCLQLMPFLLLIYFTLKIPRHRNVLYYLVAIDGVLFIKALCGLIPG